MTRRPALERVLLCFLAAFGPLAFGAVEPWSAAVLQAAVALLAWLCAGAGLPPGRLGAPARAAAFLAALGALQCLRPFDPSFPCVPGPGTAHLADTAAEAFQWAVWAALAWCAPPLLEDRGHRRAVAWTLLVCGVVVSAAGIAQKAHGNTHIYGLREVYLRQPFGPYYNRNQACLFLAVCALAGTALLWSREARRDPEASLGSALEHYLTQGALALATAFIAGAAASTRSRAGLCALVLGLAVMAAFAASRLPPRARAAAAAAAALGAAAFFAYLFLSPRWINFKARAIADSVPLRAAFYRSGARMLADHPFWGVGLGAFSRVFPLYQEAGTRGFVSHLHCDWAELWLTAGAPGFLAALAGAGSALWAAARGWGGLRSPELRALRAAGVAAWAAFGFQQLIDFGWSTPANAAILILALSWAQAGEGGSVPWGAASPASRRAARAGALLLLAGALAPAAVWAAGERAFFAPSARHARALRIGGPADSRRPPAVLREALAEARAAFASDPLDRNYRQLYSVLLWRLGRKGDAEALLRSAGL